MDFIAWKLVLTPHYEKMVLFNSPKHTFGGIFLLILALFSVRYASAQLDSIHYFPPLKTASATGAIDDQLVYFSTMETSPFDVTIYQGTSPIAIATISGLVNGWSQTYDPGNAQNNITILDDSNTGFVLTNSGLRFESSGGEKFFVNFRGRSASQAGSLTCKGQAALGTEFRWGGIPNRADKVLELNSVLGIMATENSTMVEITGYDTSCEFRQGTNPGGITSDTVSITLNAGESYVLEAVQEQVSANSAGWLGATIISDKPIAISNGGLNFGVVAAAQSRDVGIDQPVPVSKLGRDYVFIRGNGADITEFPVIIGAHNGTEVYAGGVLIGTINDGEYLEIPATNYSSTTAGANMYVRTSKDAYAYQCLAGAAGNQTVGMNFIAPLNCLLPSMVDEISTIDDIASLVTANSSVTILASTTVLDTDITVTDGSGTVSLPASDAIVGTTNWKTFYVTGLVGNVTVNATGPIAVGSFMSQGANAGLAAYFSGFDTAPAILVNETGTGCYQGATFTENTGTFDAYQWYLDGAALPGETTNSYAPTSIGDVYLEITDGTCTYETTVYPVYYCNPEVVVNKMDLADPVEEGDNATFIIDVTNQGDSTITNLVVNETLPPGLTLVSASSSKGTWSYPNWTIGDLDPGEMVTLTVVTQTDVGYGGSVVTNTVSHTQDQVDHNNELDDLSESLTIDVALPIELISFEAKIVMGEVELIWKTASERNNDYFIIERSSDAETWEEVVRRSGSGNSDEIITYWAIDDKPLPGVSYYRLTQVDYNGEAATYDLFTVKRPLHLNPLNCYPNPASKELRIAGKMSTASIRLTNFYGQDVTALAPVTYNDGKLVILDLTELAPGTYAIKSDAGQAQFLRSWDD